MSTPRAVDKSINELDALPPKFADHLRSMYGDEPQQDENGKDHSMDAGTRISVSEGLWLYRFCTAEKARRTLEVGLAYGFSTIYFLAALHTNGRGRHSAIDPWARSGQWNGLGCAKAELLGMGEAFRFIEKKSSVALGALAESKERFDVIFVDGAHMFDSVLTDFTLAAPLCAQGGTIVLDDMWMPSVQKAVAFIRTNRADFFEIPTPIENISAFRKVGKDLRPWTHFENF